MKRILCVTISIILSAILIGCDARIDPSEPHDHDYSLVVKSVSPTCSNEGWIHYKCKICGLEKSESERIPALQDGGHDYKNYVCTYCGDYLKDEAVDTPILSYKKAADNENNEFYIVTGVMKESEYIKIPSTVKGIPVTQIADGAFYNQIT